MKNNQKTTTSPFETAPTVDAREEQTQRVDRNIHALMQLSRTIQDLASRLSANGPENLTDDEKRIIRIAMLPAINEILHFAKIRYVSGAELGDVMIEVREVLEQL